MLQAHARRLAALIVGFSLALPLAAAAQGSAPSQGPTTAPTKDTPKPTAPAAPQAPAATAPAATQAAPAPGYTAPTPAKAWAAITIKSRRLGSSTLSVAKSASFYPLPLRRNRIRRPHKPRVGCLASNAATLPFNTPESSGAV